MLDVRRGGLRFGGVFDDAGAGSIAWADTAQTSGTAGTTGASSWQPSFCTGFDYMTGKVHHLGIWTGAANTTKINALDANDTANGIK